MAPPRSVDEGLHASDQVVFEVLEGEAIVLQLTSGLYFRLNKPATRIWELLREHDDVGRVRAEMLEEFDVDPGTLDTDIQELLHSLALKGLVTGPAGHPGER